MKEDLFYIILLTSIIFGIFLMGISEKNIRLASLPSQKGIAIDTTIQVEKILKYKVIKPKFKKRM